MNGDAWDWSLLDSKKTASDNKPLIEYEWNFQAYYTDAFLISNCNEIIFINQGGGEVTINGVFSLDVSGITPFRELRLRGQNLEIDKTQYAIKFAGNGAFEQKCVVIRKYYKNSNLSDNVET
jgi:hypothetical protein